MPLKAKPRLTGPKRRRTATASNPEAPSRAGIAVPGIADANEDMEETHGRMSAAARIELFATLAWSTDYLNVLKLEAEDNGAVAAVPEHPCVPLPSKAAAEECEQGHSVLEICAAYLA